MKKIIIAFAFALIFINATSISNPNAKVEDRVYSQDSSNNTSATETNNSKTPQKQVTQPNVQQHETLISERKRRAANRAEKYKNNDQPQ